ncbi:hypothetical protein STSO111631_09470 [Stackebrandtia soli]
MDDRLWSGCSCLIVQGGVDLFRSMTVDVLQGVLFVLFTSIGWEDLLQDLGFGSGMTCWRRLRRWTDAGVFDRLHQLLLAELNAAGKLDWLKVLESMPGTCGSKNRGSGVAPSLGRGVEVLGLNTTWLATETVYRSSW